MLNGGPGMLNATERPADGGGSSEPAGNGKRPGRCATRPRSDRLAIQSGVTNGARASGDPPGSNAAMSHQGKPLEVTGGLAGAIGGVLASFGVAAEGGMVAPAGEAGCGGAANSGPAGVAVAAVADAGIIQSSGYGAPCTPPAVLASSFASANH
jgi:hypothetical protein